MDKNSLSHTTWECKYHLVFAPKYRRQVIYGQIKADDNNRIARIMQRQSCSEKEAVKAMHTTDKDRARFYQYYSDKKWGDAKTYDLTIDSGKLGIDKTVELILDYVKYRFQ